MSILNITISIVRNYRKNRSKENIERPVLTKNDTLYWQFNLSGALRKYILFRIQISDIFLLMRNNLSWFQSPHPTAFNFANALVNRDIQPEEENIPRNLLTPVSLTHHLLTPLSQYHQDQRLHHPSSILQLEEQSAMRPIQDRLIFSDASSEEELQTPQREQKPEDEIQTTGRKSLNDRVKMVTKLRPKQKGLRGLSSKAFCAVLEMKVGSYKQVACKLIKQMGLSQNAQSAHEELNIKRRVYDALNVLIAAGVLRKDGRKIVSEKNSKQTKSSRQLEEEIEILNRKILIKENALNEKRRQLQVAKQKLRGAQKLLTNNVKSHASTRSSGQLIPFPFIGVANIDDWKLKI